MLALECCFQLTQSHIYFSFFCPDPFQLNATGTHRWVDVILYEMDEHICIFLGSTSTSIFVQRAPLLSSFPTYESEGLHWECSLWKAAEDSTFSLAGWCNAAGETQRAGLRGGYTHWRGQNTGRTPSLSAWARTRTTKSNLETQASKSCPKNCHCRMSGYPVCDSQCFAI